jgi:dethiobiotin synthetase
VNRKSSARIILVTGTDTGVGKTLLTALFLHHLRSRGVPALATKPFCSGGRADVELLQSLQPGELTAEEMNPFHFPEPLAPLVAAQKCGRRITLPQALERIQALRFRCRVLLIEGAGGLLTPLGVGFTAADLIRSLGCEVFVVARNQLGSINHARLTSHALKSYGIKRVVFVLMNARRPNRRARDPSTSSNPLILKEMLAPARVYELPFLGANASRIGALKRIGKKMKKKLVRILA